MELVFSGQDDITLAHIDRLLTETKTSERSLPNRIAPSVRNSAICSDEMFCRGCVDFTLDFVGGLVASTSSICRPTRF